MQCCHAVCRTCDVASCHPWPDDFFLDLVALYDWEMWSMVQPGADLDSSLIQAPSSRSKHAVVAVQEGFIYLLGGRAGNMPLKDLWRFDPVQSQWEEVRCRGNRPPSLQEHSMVAWKKKIFVFGGEVGFASTGETPLWILDTSNHTWRKPSARGISTQQPLGRRGHTTVVYNASMHLFGGYQDLRGSSSEIWSFDFGTEQWSLKLLPSHVDQPSPRHNHTSVVHDCAMWVYGGMTDLQERSDFWKWDFTSNVWSRVKNQKGPGELHSHTAVKALSFMYLFGGERGGVWLNDLWRFHFATETWERMQTEGVIPNPRCRHAALANPMLQDADGHIRTWDENVEPSSRNGKSGSNPPKSISMCFGQTTAECSESIRKPFKFRVHPAVRLCSKNTASDDDEDDDDDYLASYNHNQAQVNLSRSIKEKLSSSRLVRSISSGSYSILHHENRRDELERLVEETPPSQHRLHSIQKSLSSDAVLESDSESSTPQHRPSSSSHPPSSATTTHSSSSSDAQPLSRMSRLAYDGPLTTVRDTDEDSDLPGVVRASRRHRNVHLEDEEAALIDFDDGTYYRSKVVNGSCSLTPESCCGMPHSVSHSSGYHSLADDDPHRDFAGCLNSAGSHRVARGRDGVELKTFTPTHGCSQPFEELQNVKKERARSWDRVSKRREVKSYPCVPAESDSPPPPSSQPAGMWVRSPSKMRIEQHQWQLCMYMCGGRELGAPEVSRQPIAMWKLYV